MDETTPEAVKESHSLTDQVSTVTPAVMETQADLEDEKKDRRKRKTKAKTSSETDRARAVIRARLETTR